MPGQALTAVVEELRGAIFDGRTVPGERLDEVSLGHELAVSRNTLREAFRLLESERLVDHEPHRGVFVHRVDAREAREIYVARRLVECGALREAAVLRSGGLGPVSPQVEAEWLTRVDAVLAAVADGRTAAAAGDWEAVGSANGRFHLALVALSGNAVLLAIAGRLQTQVRLAFVAAANAKEAHERYVEWNGRVAALVAAGELGRAAVVLEEYLYRAERHLVAGL